MRRWSYGGATDITHDLLVATSRARRSCVLAMLLAVRLWMAGLFAIFVLRRCIGSAN